MRIVLFVWDHLYTVHSFRTHQNLRPTCLLPLCIHCLEQPFSSYLKFRICSFIQIRHITPSISAVQPTNKCVCVRERDLHKCVLLTMMNSVTRQELPRDGALYKYSLLLLNLDLKPLPIAHPVCKLKGVDESYFICNPR